MLSERRHEQFMMFLRVWCVGGWRVIIVFVFLFLLFLVLLFVFLCLVLFLVVLFLFALNQSEGWERIIAPPGHMNCQRSGPGRWILGGGGNSMPRGPKPMEIVH